MKPTEGPYQGNTNGLPADFPYAALRKNGRPDNRRRITSHLKLYLADLEYRRTHGLRALSWLRWNDRTRPR
jgi:hypothetical protein